MSVSYPSLPLRDLSGVAEFAENEPFPFRFPLDEIIANESLVSAPFCASGKPPGSAREYHAAEDFQRPAGTPVYAMADGKISFSGPMGGYGWLIIIDHPQANLYSLYGHLSPSRWRIKSGTVEKGELIAYLGDPDENGGSTERPLRPHLHLGVRVGQKSDYPGFGEGRWMAGWIKPYPPDLGWMQPSAIITGQIIPAEGFPDLESGLMAIWWKELLFSGIYLFGGICMLFFSLKRKKPLVSVIAGIAYLLIGWILSTKGAKTSYVIFGLAFILFVIGIFKLIRRQIKMAQTRS